MVKPKEKLLTLGELALAVKKTRDSLWGYRIKSIRRDYNKKVKVNKNLTDMLVKLEAEFAKTNKSPAVIEDLLEVLEVHF